MLILCRMVLNTCRFSDGLESVLFSVLTAVVVNLDSATDAFGQ